MGLSAIVLAAGKGTRMRSELPKPLHTARGRTMLGWVIHALGDLQLDSVVVVVGHGKQLVVDALEQDFDRPFLFAEQKSQRGTGDAAAVGLAELDVFDNRFSEDDHVLVLPGDTPLLRPATMHGLVSAHRERAAAATIVTTSLQDPTGYGRILRTDRGEVAAIIEHRDASPEQQTIREINAGMYCFRRSLLGPALRLISSDNSQGELYLTDAVGVLAEAGHTVAPFPADPVEISGVNDRAQLGAAAAHLGERIAHQHMQNGVTIVQPTSTVIDASVTIEPDATIQPGCVLEGATVVHAGAVVGPHSHLVDATVGAGAQVHSSTVVGESLAPGDRLGPYESLTAPTERPAELRQGSEA